MKTAIQVLPLITAVLSTISQAMAAAAPPDQPPPATQWRAEHRLVDLHQHVAYSEPTLRRAIKIMDAAGLGVAINLSGGSVTHRPGEKSEFETNKELADRLFPGRFLHYFSLDYSGWGDPDFAERAVRQVEEGHRLGAAGFKEFKRLGLYLKDRSGKLIKVDDPQLDPVWRRCGELGLPVSIHVADPKAFWLPFDAANERWKELKDHKSWWFGDPQKYPSWKSLLEDLNRVVARHPKTTFVCVHFANNAEEVETVDRWLDTYPNMMADLAARIPEIGRHDPDLVRRIFIKHQDRILFGTDFMVYDQLILGSGGSGPPPTDEDAVRFYAKHWQWMETRDRGFEHMTPIQGDWTIDAIGLPASVLRKIYFDNARRLLAAVWPLPRIQAQRLDQDFKLDGDLTKSAWNGVPPARMEYQSGNTRSVPELSTSVQILWSDKYLYLAYRCPFTRLTTFEPPNLAAERIGLWDRDVVEAFIADETSRLDQYLEFEWAPTGEQLDLLIDGPRKDFAWSSGCESVVKVDAKAGIWTAEIRIPMTALTKKMPVPGAQWRLNFYRCDYANRAFLAWNPTGKSTFHAPEKFGILEFMGAKK